MVTSRVVTPVAAGATAATAVLLSPWCPRPRNARYVNLGPNSFEVKYNTDTRDEFGKPAPPYTSTILAGQEFFETGVTAPLFALSQLGTSILSIIDLGAD